MEVKGLREGENDRKRARDIKRGNVCLITFLHMVYSHMRSEDADGCFIDGESMSD